MQALNREGVEFDMCPACRGVWLDRGELEKIMQSARETAPAALAPARHQPARRPEPSDGHGERRAFGERGEYGERGESGEPGDYGWGHGPRRRKRGFDLFDIFD